MALYCVVGILSTHDLGLSGSIEVVLLARLRDLLKGEEGLFDVQRGCWLLDVEGFLVHWETRSNRVTSFCMSEMCDLHFIP